MLQTQSTVFSPLETFNLGAARALLHERDIEVICRKQTLVGAVLYPLMLTGARVAATRFTKGRTQFVSAGYCSEAGLP